MIIKSLKFLTGAASILLGDKHRQRHLRIPSGNDFAAELATYTENERSLEENVCQGHTLIGGNILSVGQFLCAAEFRFGMDNSGGLQLQKLALGNDNEWQMQWQALDKGGAPVAGSYVRLQVDGNLVVYDDQDNSLWATHTASYPNSKVTLYNGGGVQLTSEEGVVVWEQETGRDWYCVGDSLEAGGELEDGEYICKDVVTVGFVDGRLLYERYDAGDHSWSQEFESHLWTGGQGEKAAMQVDGNLVIYAGGEALWSSRTNRNPGAKLEIIDSPVLAGSPLSNVHEKCVGEELPPGGRLDSGEFLCNGYGQYLFGMDTIGDLSFFDKVERNEKLWSAGTKGSYSNYVRMQSDGNLVVYSFDHIALWASNTGGNSGAKLLLEVGGDVKVKSQDGATLWSLEEGQFLKDTPTCLGQVSAGQVFNRNEMLSCYFGVDLDGRMTRTGWEYYLTPSLHFGSYYDTGGRFGAYAVFQQDGNFVVYTNDGEALWSTRTNIGYPKEELRVHCRSRDFLCPLEFLSDAEVKEWRSKEKFYCRGNRLQQDERLDAEEFICSTAHDHRFGLDKRGDLGIWLRGKKCSSMGTSGSYANHLIMQDDGNLVLYDYNENALWSSGTTSGSSVGISDEGKVAVFDENDHPIWEL